MLAINNAAIQSNIEDVMFYFIFLCDDTGSMGEFINSMHSTLGQLIPIVRVLLKGQAEVRVFTYNDHEQKEVIRSQFGINGNLNEFLKETYARCGSFPGEASKAGFNAVWQSVQTDIDAGTPVKAFCFHYGDDYPHCLMTGKFDSQQYKAEKKFIEDSGGIFDWKELVQKFKDLQINVYNILAPQHENLVAFYGMMGPVVELDDTDSDTVTKATIGVLLQILGQNFSYSTEDQFGVLEYNAAEAEQLVNEMEYDDRFKANAADDDIAAMYCEKTLNYTQRATFNVPQATELLGQTVQLQELMRTSRSYRTLVYKILDHLLDQGHAKVLSYNSVLAQLCVLFFQNGDEDQARALKDKVRRSLNQITGEGLRELNAQL